MLYFSGGLTRNGIENQASMRAATNEAVKANMAIYSVDTRGLQALPPVGDATTGSLRGVSAYSGGAMQSQLDANFASQETLGTLASDTGGKSFFDSNDFAAAFTQVQHDTEAYYILGFRSTNTARDGAFRHLTIKVNRPDVNSTTAPATTPPQTSSTQKTEDREQALDEQLRSDSPATDVSLYLQALYFREHDNRFFVPVSLIVPGSPVPFLKNGDKDKANLDIVGQVKNAAGILVGNIRDTVKLALDRAQQVAQKNIQYSTGFTLAPGRYHLKFVVRENQTGNMGSFETDIQVPDLARAPLKLSSVVLASQRTPNPQKNPSNRPARPRRRRVDPQHPARLPPGPAPLLPLRGLRPLHAKAAKPRRSPPPPPASAAALPSAASTSSPASSSCWAAPRSMKPRSSKPPPSTPRPRRRRLPVRRPARPAQTRHLRLPGQRHRRCRRQLQLSSHGSARHRSRRHRARNPARSPRAHRRPLTTTHPEPKPKPPRNLSLHPLHATEHSLCPIDTLCAREQYMSAR